MTTKLEDPNSNAPKRPRLRRFIRYAVVTVFVYITIMGIVNAPNMMATALMFAIFWGIGVIIYRTRHGWSGWMSSDQPLAEYVKDRKAARIPVVSQTATANEATVVKVYDYSEADNEHMQPLSSSERSVFDSLTENFD